MASQDRDKASAHLLRQSLRDSAEACPEPEILAAYFERSLDAEETARYELHLSQCARCRDELAAMHRAAERVAAGGAAPHETRRMWLWDWRLLAPAAAVIVVAAVWIARYSGQRRTATDSSQTRLVAMSRQSGAPAPPAAAPMPDHDAGASVESAPKTFVTPASGVAAGALEPQAPARTRTLDDKEKQETAANIPQMTGNELRSDALAKDAGTLKRDSNSAESDEASQALNSRDVAPAPAAAPPKAASGTGAAVGGNAETVIVEAEVKSVAPTSPATAGKPTGAATGVRTLTQQAQTQSVMQSRALALEAFSQPAKINFIATPDPKVMWRIDADGTVELSKDSGKTWQGQQLRSFQPNPQITTGYAPTTKICWLVGRDGAILLTRDAAHWVPIPPPVTTDFVGVTARDSFSATVTAADGRKFSTDDAGDHWNPAPQAVSK